MFDVVVIGGGITGLAAAYHLQRLAAKESSALSCALIERDRRLGGKLLTHRHEGLLIEVGPDSMLSRKPWGVQLCRDLGLGDDLVGTGTSGSFVRLGGRLLPLPEGMSMIAPTRWRAVAKTPLFSMWGKARMGAEYFLPARRGEGDESLADFVSRRFGREAAERLAEPLLSGIYAGDARKLSVDATFPQFKAMEKRHGSLIKAALAQQRAAKSRPAATADPSLPNSLFLALKDGFGSLVSALADALGKADVALIQGAGVKRASRAGDGAYLLQLDDGRTIKTRGLLLATPAYASAAILQDLAPELASELSAIPYASVGGVVLAYPENAVERPLEGTGYLVPRVEGGAVTAYTWVTAKWPHTTPKGTLLFRCHMGRFGSDVADAWSDEAMIQAAKDELRRTMGVTAEPRFVRVYRWPKAMPQYEVGHLERLGKLDRALLGLPKVRLCGAAYRGVGVPDCIRQGFEAAESVFAEL